MKLHLLLATAAAALATGAVSGAASAQSFSGPPPAARPGECYARIIRPAEYDATPETIVTREAYEQLSVSKAEFSASSQQVMTKEAGIRYDVKQPTWTTTTETIVVKPAYDKLSIIPAKFETKTETVVVGEPRMVWKKGANLSSIKKVDAKSGEVWCLVEEPARTETVTRKVLVSPEQISRITVPAETKTVTRQVMADRGGVREIETPAEYRAVPVMEVSRPAESQTLQVPAQTATIDRLRLRSPERQDWVQVLCETNATTDRIVKLQTALAGRGYYKGPIDGISGGGTQKAVEAFERDNHIPHSGNVSMETLHLLGVDGGASDGAPATGGDDRLDGGAHVRPSSYAPSRSEAPNANSIYADNDRGQDKDQLAGGPSYRTGAAPAAMAATARPVAARREYSVRKRLNWGQDKQ
jgi:peptidoglycan hydrolase-like protein with peptidoglycan-binding domain